MEMINRIAAAAAAAAHHRQMIDSPNKQTLNAAHITLLCQTTYLAAYNH